MTFKVFNVARGLSQTQVDYQLYDPENPPFGISCLSQIALDEFQKLAGQYDKSFKTEVVQDDDVSSDVVTNDMPKKIQIFNLEKLPFEDGKISHWHIQAVKILSQEASWALYSHKSNKDLKIEELKELLFENISYGAFTLEALCEQSKHLKLITHYYKNCLSELSAIRSRMWTHSRPPVLGRKLPGYFCPNFGKFLENYLTELNASINLEKQKLASAMLARLTVASITKDIKNGDLLFFLAKSIEDLCKGSFLINEDKAKNQATVIENLRAKLGQDRTKNPGSHAILDWHLVPNAPQRSLDYKAYKVFWKLIVSLPDDDISKLTKNKFANLRWFTQDSGIKVETIKYPEGFILVPKVNNKSENFSINAKVLKTPFIPHPGAVIEMNEGLHTLEKLMRSCFFIAPSSVEKEAAQPLSQKAKASFQMWLKGQKIEDIKNLAEAIVLSNQGILYLFELLKKYDVRVTEKSIAEKQFYDLWDSELKRCLIKLNKYCDTLILLFKESISVPQVIYLSPIIRAIKQYAERLDKVSFKDKGKIESLFGTLRQEKIDVHFFSVFVDNLKNPKGAFIAKTKDALELYTHDTEDSRGLIDLLAVMSSDPATIKLIGDVWKGTSYPSLSSLKRAIKVFQEKVPSESVDELLHLLLKSLLRTLETENAPGFGLLIQYHQEELVRTPDRDTLLTQWRSVQNNNYCQTVCKELELLIKQHEDNYIRTRGSYDENPMVLECTRLSNLLPDVLDLEESQKNFLIHALNRMIDKKTEIDHWNLLPILIKINDLNTARKYLGKRLIPLLRDTFLVGLANSSELSCFSKLFEKFPSLKKEIQKDIFSKVSYLLNTFKNKTSGDLENILRNKFTENSFNLSGIAKIAAVFFDDENQQRIGTELDTFFFSQLKTCVNNQSYLEFLLKNNQEFPLQKTFSVQLTPFVVQFEKADWNFQQAVF